MSIAKTYFVYILANRYNNVFYTGVTGDLLRRVHEHRSGSGSQFTRKYLVHKLVYFEMSEDVISAITREKQIKGGSRQKKIDLIVSMNPDWKDLFLEFVDE